MFYTRMQDLAKNLISEYGTSGTIRAFDSNNIESVAGTFTYVQTALTIENLPDTLVGTFDTKIYVSSLNSVPMKNDYVRLHDNTLYKVVETEEYKPADKSLLFAVYLKK